MELISIPEFIMASINFYVASYYLFIFLKRNKMLNYLSFSLLCFSVGIYDVLCIGLYNSHSIEQGIFWQRLQLNVIFFISIFVIWFITILTEQKKNRIIKFYILWYILLLILSFFVKDEYTLSLLNPAIKDINISHLIHITYYEVDIGLIYTIEVISSLSVYLYLIFLLLRFYKKKKDKKIILILLSQISYFFGFINDTLVAYRIYNFIYISEYSFLLVILVMSYVLLNDFVNLHAAVEKSNMELEKKVSERTKEIKKLNDELKKLVDIDGLTGIYNRRFFNRYFELELKRANNEIKYSRFKADKPNDMNFGLAMVDIDDFKKINDIFGHLAGDRVLIETVNLIKENIFIRDIFCRYGGEEFVLLFTRTSGAGIIQALEKIRKSIYEHSFYINKNNKAYYITVSIGAVTFDEAIHNKNEDMLKIADSRLLLAKKAGKNRVIYK